MTGPWISGESLSPSRLNLHQGGATLVTGFSTDTLQGQSGLTINVISDLSVQNTAAAQRIELGGAPSSTSGLLSLRAHSSTTDYLFLQDSTGIKSNFLLGLRTGDSNASQVDGLNLYDSSHNTMIARFSNDSVRFYPPIVAPVFDSGGALASTYNAALFLRGSSKESQIQAAINSAVADGIARVYVPANMYPYNAALITFNAHVQMIREGGDSTQWDVQAYGADALGVADVGVSFNAARAGLPDRGGPIRVSAGTYNFVTAFSFATRSNVDVFIDAGSVFTGQTLPDSSSASNNNYINFSGSGLIVGMRATSPTAGALTVNQSAGVGGLVLNQIGNMDSSALLIQSGQLGTFSNSPIVNILQSWNSATAIPSAVKVNITNTASHASARLLDLLVDSGDKFVVGVDGAIISASSHPKVTITQGTFSSPFDTAVYIAPEPKSAWTIDSQGLYVVHRLSGSAATTGSPTHDGIAGDLSLSGSQYTKGTGNAIEASVIINGVNSTASDLRSLTANMTANSGTTGVLTSLSIVRAQAAVNNSAASYSIGTVVGMWAEQQTVGATNLNIYAPGGLSRFGSVVIEQVTGTPFTVASGGAGDGQNAYSMLDGIRIGGEDRLNTIYNSSRSIGITADSGATIFLGQVSSTVSGLAISTTSGDVKFNSGASININQARLLSVRTAASLDSTTLAVNEMAFTIVAGSAAQLAIRSGGTIYFFASSSSTKG